MRMTQILAVKEGGRSSRPYFTQARTSTSAQTALGRDARVPAVETTALLMTNFGALRSVGVSPAAIGASRPDGWIEPDNSLLRAQPNIRVQPMPSLGPRFQEGAPHRRGVHRCGQLEID